MKNGWPAIKNTCAKILKRDPLDSTKIRMPIVNAHSNYKFESLLHRAVKKGDLSGVRKLVDQGLIINDTDSDGRSPLFYAVIDDHCHCLEWLLKHGAQIDLMDYQQQTALFVACENYKLNKLPQIKLLLANGANINSQNSKNETPLLAALKSAFIDIDLVTLCMDYGADLEIENNQHETAGYLIFDNPRFHKKGKFLSEYYAASREKSVLLNLLMPSPEGHQHNEGTLLF